MSRCGLQDLGGASALQPFLRRMFAPRWVPVLAVIILGLYRDNGKENGNYYNGLYRGYIGIMENQMEKKMENETETSGTIRWVVSPAWISGYQNAIIPEV